jgi:hypothetical protein
MLNMWERLPAAIETNSSDAGYFMNALAKTRTSTRTCAKKLKQNTEI